MQQSNYIHIVIEIERKFLVTSKNYREEAVSKQRITQGFLNTDPARTVRVRLNDDFGYLTIKGRSNDTGTSRFEWEKEIEAHEAKALLEICEIGIIDKTRYVITNGKHVFEVDEFHGDNNGLVIAEIELDHEEEEFDKPKWIGKEVTGEVKYYNSQLSKKPFIKW